MESKKFPVDQGCPKVVAVLDLWQKGNGQSNHYPLQICNLRGNEIEIVVSYHNGSSHLTEFLELEDEGKFVVARLSTSDDIRVFVVRGKESSTCERFFANNKQYPMTILEIQRRIPERDFASTAKIVNDWIRELRPNNNSEYLVSENFNTPDVR